MAEKVIVNGYYPLGYFSHTDLDQFAETPPDQFWASQEAAPTAEEFLIFDFSRARPCSFIDFEICQKPIDIKIEYLDTDGVTYKEVTPKEHIDPSFSIAYVPSENNPWAYFECHFHVVTTRKIKVTFARRADPFPFPDSTLFPWSIEVRNLRVIHYIATLDEFLEDSGVDILGNEYRTDIEVYDSENVLDFDTATFWQSQPNPSRFAVEYLFFDLRQGWRVGTMGFLNSQVLDETDDIEGDTMSDIELKFVDGALIDEVYLDPVTDGPTMNVYYSDDDQADWEDKLWIPITRQYPVKKGFHSLPHPTFVKFVKLEFTNLVAAPYNTLDYPSAAPMQYRKFPTWVRNYFLGLYPVQPEGLATQPNQEIIIIDPTELGFMNPVDRFNTKHTEIEHRPDSFEKGESEVKDFIKTTVNGSVITPTDAEITFKSPTYFRQDMSVLIDRSRAFGRYTYNQADLPWMIEVTPAPTEEITFQSREDIQENFETLKQPNMYFPRKARHGYQIIEAIRPAKIAYFIALREISFHRRDYTVEWDEPFYIETLDDDDHVALNEFEADNWRYVVTANPNLPSLANPQSVEEFFENLTFGDGLFGDGTFGGS